MTVEASGVPTPHFQDELTHLKNRLLRMAGLAEERLRMSIRALVDRDRDLAATVSDGDGPINALHLEIDDQALRLLALHQPVAVDLRAIIAAIKINTDLERVGDLAVNIVEAITRYIVHPPVKQLIDIPRMTTVAEGMLHDALDAYVRGDAGLAMAVLRRDDELDGLQAQVLRELLTYMLQDPHTTEPALELILISRHLERVGDHATNVAEDVIFMVTGEDVRHHARDAGLASDSTTID